MAFTFDLDRVRCLLGFVVVTVAALGLGVELREGLLGYVDPWLLKPTLSLSYESNLPTWVSALLLASCAGLLALRASLEVRAGGAWCWHWRLLAGAFLYVSLDESIRLHERLNGWFEFGGVLYFGWVLPAGAVVLLLALGLRRFLWALPPRTRRGFLLAGLLYVGGALGMELPLGWWTERHGSDGFGYAAIDWVEETLELCGVCVMLATLLRDIAGPADTLRLVLGAPTTQGAAETAGSASR